MPTSRYRATCPFCRVQQRIPADFKEGAWTCLSCIQSIWVEDCTVRTFSTERLGLCPECHELHKMTSKEIMFVHDAPNGDGACEGSGRIAIGTVRGGL